MTINFESGILWEGLMKVRFSSGITWRQPIVFIIATVVSTALAIWAVVGAPVELVPGVSGLYIAAAVYVPLALWFGIWGCLAGYFSCFFMGMYLNFMGIPGYTLSFVAVWSLADFFEGLVPLLIYRQIRVKPSLKLKRPKATFALMALLVSDVVGSAWALTSSLTDFFIATFVIGIALLIAQAIVEDSKTWLIWLAVGVVLASIVSGVFGVGALAAFGNIPMKIFPTVLFGWVFGDIIVLSTVGTVVAIILTSYIVKSRLHVKRFIS
jgi:hypothetical protein